MAFAPVREGISGWLFGLLVIAIAHGPASAQAIAIPEMPRAYVDTTPLGAPARVLTVAAGGDFQGALNTAQPGDMITLAAGVTFTGNFTLPAKIGTGWITVRTSAPDEHLPLPGVRITPAYVARLPKVVSPNANPALATAAGAHHYRLVGIEVTVGGSVSSNNGLVRLGSGTETSLAEIPHDIVLDRVYIHGSPTVSLRRNLALNSARTAVVDSHLSDAHDAVFDAQAICGWSGPGPFKIVNNYLEGSGQNLMFGGADPRIVDLVPSDIEIRGNHFFKPRSWRVGDPSFGGTHWMVKNLLELKNAQRILIDGNVFEHNWADGQAGMGILFTVRNQDGHAPWSVVQDVTFTNNVLRHSAGGIHILGRDDNHPSRRTSRVLIRNNLFEDVDGARWGGRGRLFTVNNGADGVVIEHVTALNTGEILGADLAPNTGFVFRNNIASDNGFGVLADSGSMANLSKYFPGAVLVNNALPGGRSRDYPSGNFFPPSLADVHFVDLAEGDYRLAASSPYRAAGTDGRDLGANNPGPPSSPVLAAAVLPTSRSVQVGATATVFATIIATGPTTATGCTISPPSGLPVAFSFQANGASNAAAVAPGTPVDIPGGASRSYVIALTPTAPFGPVDVELVYRCTNTAPADTISGVTTLLLSATGAPGPDIIAVGATTTLDGIVSIRGPDGTGVFAVAAVNIGASATITVTADSGRASLPVALSLCETNPANGQCINPTAPAPSATVQIGTGQMPTFAIFVQGHGNVAFLPDVNRAFVRFRTAGGDIVGATSAAIGTQ